MPAPQTKSALLVLGLGVLFPAVLIPAGHLLASTLGDRAELSMANVGEKAGIVLFLWAVVIAYRALRADEPHSPPIVILLVSAVGLGIQGVSGWFSARSYDTSNQVLFFPVLLPFLSMIILASAGMILYQFHSSDDSDSPPHISAERWRRTHRWIVRVTVISGIVLIPLPLFVMCAVWPGGIRTTIARHTPSFICDAAERHFRGTNDYFHARIIEQGNVSNQLLVEHIREPIAYEALLERAPADASLKPLLESCLSSGNYRNTLPILIKYADDPYRFIDTQLSEGDMGKFQYLIDLGRNRWTGLDEQYRNYAAWSALALPDRTRRDIALQNFYWQPAKFAVVTKSQFLKRMLALLGEEDLITSRLVVRSLDRSNENNMPAWAWDIRFDAKWDSSIGLFRRNSQGNLPHIRGEESFYYDLRQALQSYVDSLPER